MQNYSILLRIPLHKHTFCLLKIILADKKKTQATLSLAFCFLFGQKPDKKETKRQNCKSNDRQTTVQHVAPTKSERPPQPAKKWQAATFPLHPAPHSIQTAPVHNGHNRQFDKTRHDERGVLFTSCHRNALFFYKVASGQK